MGENPAGKPLGDERPERREDKPADTTAKESAPRTRRQGIRRQVA